MIIGIGNDLVDIRRIEKALQRHGTRFENRCFTEAERAKASTRLKAQTYSHVFAKRFAAKEACAKALGTGFAQGVHMKDIGVTEDTHGRPFLSLTGGAEKQLRRLTPEGHKAMIHLSLTDDYPYAQAFVVIETSPI